MYIYKALSQKEKEELLRYRKEHRYPLHSPPHLSEPQRYYLITAATYYHQPAFKTAELLNLLENMLLETIAKQRMQCEAWVVMPNHYHVLVELGCGAADYRKIAERVHSNTSFRLNRLERAKGRTVWYRYADRMMRSERHFLATINYIHFNPQKHGWCEDYTQWQWSSVRRYVEEVSRKELDDMMNRYDLRGFGKGWDEM